MGNKVTYLGELEQMLLWTVLRLRDGAYGMAVRDELEARSGRDASRGSVYITLDRLVGKGYLATRMGSSTPARGGRKRRYFEVTDEGKAALREAREALVSVWAGLESVVEEA
ncbi:MAG: helix-turn-helix transcriptional regulator [Longimicrobiales bacterium]